MMAARFDELPAGIAQRVAATGQALDDGRVELADRHLSDIDPCYLDHPEVLRMRAGVLGMRGRHPEAIALMQRAVEQRPVDPAYQNTLGTLLGQAGEYDAAVEALRRSCELQPDLALAWYNLGVMLTRCVRNAEAAVALEHAVALAPDHAGARALLADLWRMQGKADAAAAEYRRLLAVQPAAGMAWWGLADLRTAHFSEQDVRLMEQVSASGKANDDDLIAIGFALARAYEDTGRYTDALASLARANAMARQRRRWPAASFTVGLEAIRSAFAAAPAPVEGDLGHDVVFIVGLPRSGSTLVEQILASHSSVEGAGELPDLPQVLAEESRRRSKPFPTWVADMQPQDWARLGRRYLERTAHWRRQRPVATDKLPSNWIYLAAIRAMLPGAHIIGCRRDPLETCFACYRQHMHNNEYSRTFADLASFYRDYDRNLRVASAQHPLHVLEHAYESLLADPRGCITALLGFCGLPFEEACLHFHQNAREVRSPSATQVRRPLDTRTARTPRYGALLDPLRAALGLPAWQA